MPVSVFPEYRVASRKKENFSAFYGALVLLSLHWAFILYINSSYLEQFVSGKIVGLLYVISALITISVFLYATHFLNAIGNYHFIVLLTVLEGAVLIGMAHAHTATWALPLFVLHQAIVPLILFCLDIFMEEMVGEEEQTTGGRRGLLLTIMSLMGALASLASGYIIGDGIPNFSFAYTISALLLIPFLLIIIGCFRKFVDPPYHNFDIIRGFTCFWSQSDMRNVFFAHFLLQLFFAWMVIYTPIYLATVVGFNWKEIGEILFGGLMAYVFLEYIIGVIADKWLGEKEMMALGFVIMAIATSWFVFLDKPIVTVWMLAMFITRVGASFVETTTEVYFFKHTGGKDTDLISFFRITRPLSYIIGAALGSLSLYFFSFELLFVLLGLLMIPGLFFAMALKDTK